MAPFVSDYTNHELVEVVREVTLHVDRRRPTAVSMRRFDAARAAAGHPTAPRASQICARLRMSWPEVKEVAHDAKREVDRTLGARLSADEMPEATLDDAIHCLRAVSSRLGGVALNPAIYDRECEIIRAENLRRWRYGRAIAVPTANQVAELAGSFAAACKAAGVALSSRGRPVNSPRRWTEEELIEALVRLMDEHPGVDITQRSYRTLRDGRAEFPPASSFNKAGRPGLVAYRAEAIRRRRQRKKRS